MKARAIIDGASLGLAALKAIGRAFDEAWARIARNFGDDPKEIEEARYWLANAMVSVAREESRDVEMLKRAALEAMALGYRDRPRLPRRGLESPDATVFSGQGEEPTHRERSYREQRETDASLAERRRSRDARACGHERLHCISVLEHERAVWRSFFGVGEKGRLPSMSRCKSLRRGSWRALMSGCVTLRWGSW
jgi:hypothetical protein